MEEENREFQKALSNFTHEMASAGAIRHLADLGYTAEEIRDRLDYPTPIERIRDTMDQYETEKKTKAEGKGYEIVREFDAYGRPSFRRKPVKPEDQE